MAVARDALRVARRHRDVVREARVSHVRVARSVRIRIHQAVDVRRARGTADRRLRVVLHHDDEDAAELRDARRAHAVTTGAAAEPVAHVPHEDASAVLPLSDASLALPSLVVAPSLDASLFDASALVASPLPASCVDEPSDVASPEVPSVAAASRSFDAVVAASEPHAASEKAAREVAIERKSLGRRRDCAPRFRLRAETGTGAREMAT